MARAVGAAALQEDIVRRLGALGPAGLRQVRERVMELSRACELTYTQEDGTTEIMPILLAPAVLARADQAYLHRICRVLTGAFERTAAARRTHPLVREVLPLEPAEEEWLRLSPRRPGPVVGRFDLNVDPARGGARTAALLELNGCAVGGIHYGPATTDTVRSELRALGLPPLRPSAAMSDVWLEICRAHARRLGRRGLSLVWLEDRDWEAGITEGPTLVRRLEEMGHPASVCDPRELSIRRGELHLGRRRVDVVYRGIELRDILLVEEEAGTLHALREAVRRGQVLSPIEGDLDHKSLLEVWSSQRFARLFSAAERAVFRRHVPWTRLLGERFTDGPDGRRVDLPAHAQRHRTRLVLKPNRSCGGEGILIGRETPAAVWERAIAAALRGEAPAVVQAWIPGATLESPVLRGGRALRERYYTNYGLLTSPRRIGVLGRAAPFPVVNVSRGGGVLGVLFA
ncbi:MAG TPA: hypothetical protein VFU21_32305 [Kofleriaceae bacterium]|nr:hypothetical protein [Kofleriaceae bacterium]